MTNDAIEQRLESLGLAWPPTPQPLGAYRAVVIRDGIGAVSGQFPLSAGSLISTGRVGAELSEAEGRRAAQVAALNVLAQIRAALGGFQRLVGLLRLDGYVASAYGFISQPAVLDGASDLFVAVLGPRMGAHARTAFAVSQLPMNSPIELAVTFAADRE